MRRKRQILPISYTTNIAVIQGGFIRSRSTRAEASRELCASAFLGGSREILGKRSAYNVFMVFIGSLESDGNLHSLVRYGRGFLRVFKGSCRKFL